MHISWFSDQNASWKGIYCPREPFKVQLQVRHQWQSKASLSAFDNQGLRGGSHAPERYLTLSYSFSHLHSLTYRSLRPVHVLKYSWPCSLCHLRISKWEAQGRGKSSYYEILWSSTNVKAVIYKPRSISSLPLTVTISSLLISTPELLWRTDDMAIQTKWQICCVFFNIHWAVTMYAICFPLQWISSWHNIRYQSWKWYVKLLTADL